MLGKNEYFLFVYGTLKMGYPNSDYLAHADFLGDFEVNGCMMAELEYMPALVTYPVFNNEAKAARVKGEVYCVSSAHLQQIDKLEGHPRLFERMELCWLELTPGRYVRIQTYIWKGNLKGYPSIYEWTKKPVARELLSLESSS